MTRISILIATAFALSSIAGTALAEQHTSRDRNVKTVVIQEKVTHGRDAQKVLVKKQDTRARNSKTVVVQKSVAKQQRRSVGNRFNQRDVVVIQDWDRRGLRRPGRGEVYAINGDAIYLLTASSLIVKALMN
ncbi:hypothetical protein [Roseovarius arcticus]|uniref:hypothetical protein n=1 Tax=Roseovarius arcticus TaxID=2547404 RepID=UPI0011100A17|nr:hypothetical protein [Roseovarius arcticus]